MLCVGFAQQSFHVDHRLEERPQLYPPDLGVSSTQVRALAEFQRPQPLWQGEWLLRRGGTKSLFSSITYLLHNFWHHEQTVGFGRRVAKCVFVGNRRTD